MSGYWKNDGERLEAKCERLKAEVARLWDVLSWIDGFDPETTAAAEAKFGFDLARRALEQARKE